MKKKVTVKVFMPLLFFAALFCTLLGGFLINGSAMASVHAQELDSLEKGETDSGSKVESTDRTDGADEMSGTGEAEEADGTVSGNTIPEPECICKEKCTQHAGYEYFTIYAMDNAGNMSEVYKTRNPYYQNPENTGSNEKNPAEQLPASAQATKPTSATAQVTEHTVTDSEGNTTLEMSLAEQKKAAMREAALEENGNEKIEASEKGKEFYTIRTESEKVFYLVIDRDGEEETVYFLTEISENDLLNVTTDNSDTLPKNSAALESAIPVLEGALPEGAENGTDEENGEEEIPGEPETDETLENIETESESQAATYIILGVVAVGVIGGAYYFKVVRKKKEDFLDEDDEEDEEEYLDDSEEENGAASDEGEGADAENDFLDDKED